MLQLWETPAECMEELPLSVRKLLLASTILFTQVGDGYGALLYHPDFEYQGKRAPAFFWIHQDTIVEPTLLTHDRGRRNYAEAIIHLLAKTVLCNFETPSSDTTFIDLSCPMVNELRLYLSDDPKDSSLEMIWDLLV